MSYRLTSKNCTTSAPMNPAHNPTTDVRKAVLAGMIVEDIGTTVIVKLWWDIYNNQTRCF